MTPDPKWLEILKASGWQTGMLALACLVFVLLAVFSAIPTEPWMIILAVIGLLFFTALWSASVGKATQPLVLRRFAIRREKRKVADYIPYMTPKERQIIGYLLKRNQKSFDCALDFGHAASLRGRGIIAINAVRGQRLDADHLPVMVPDHIWDVLETHCDQFPYKPELGDSGVEVYPWRRGWME